VAIFPLWVKGRCEEVYSVLIIILFARGKVDLIRCLILVGSWDDFPRECCRMCDISSHQGKSIQAFYLLSLLVDYEMIGLAYVHGIMNYFMAVIWDIEAAKIMLDVIVMHGHDLG
jgi:hypothetical protein